MSEARDLPDLVIPGYEFIERLGAGGYGEVWQAEVPGGLQKAVKLVFGSCDQQRAASELRAMERVKALRHPFLLSLERIEVVEGRLVIVTELAEGSLRDRYVHYREEGLRGIPRDELLGYLSDASDALDFICLEHELQHLDVKPENLLLVGGHVKLADFGLVKELYTTQASIVAGMTPTYAAPELFQGRATTSSDQYSLAILYQELLTGTTPFAGKTAAELTLQHLNELPDLEPLDEGDRFVISQALSKDPTHRFASCKEFLAALRSQAAPLSGAATAEASCGGPRSGGTAATEPQGGTVVFEEAIVEAFAAVDCELVSLPPAEPCLTVPPPECVEGFDGLTPTLVIGLGRSAAQVMRQLRSQVAAAYGPAALAGIRTLLIDNDPKSIGEATREGLPGVALTQADTVTVPLKRPQDYRNAAPKLLKWMSRRWLYNIPKSLCTEGIRPLGRLAVVDHARQVTQRLREALQDLVDLPQAAEIEQVTKHSVRSGALRVYLVGSISAGIAGGGMLDLAYLVRALLQRMELDHSSVVGLALHATSREADKGELGRVNAVAWLNEWHHYSRNNVAYPGDDAAGLPDHPPGVPPFDATYLVGMGDRVDQASYQNEIEAVANYLLVDTFTAAQSQLDACRRQSGSATGLRTFKLQTQKRLPTETTDQWAHRLVVALLNRWSGEEGFAGPHDDEDESTKPLVHGLTTQLVKQRLDANGLGADCKAIIEALMGGNPLQGLRQQIINRGFTPDTLSFEHGLGIMHEMLHRREDGGWALGSTDPEDELQRLAKARATRLVAWLSERIDTPGERIEAATRGIVLAKHFLADQRDRLDRTATPLREASCPPAPVRGSTASDEVGKQLVKELRLRTDQAAAWLAAQLSWLVEWELDQFATRLQQTQQQVADTLQALLPTEESTDELDDPLSERDQVLALQSLTVELDRQMQEDYLASAGGFLAACTDPECLDELTQKMHATAAQVAATSPLIRRLASANSHPETSGPDEPAERVLPSVGFAEHGGQSCCVIVEPSRSSSTIEYSDGVARVTSPLVETFTLSEAWDLSAPHVAATLIGGRQDYAQLATRVGTRTDVPWTTVFQGQSKPVPPALAPIHPSNSTVPLPVSDPALS